MVVAKELSSGNETTMETGYLTWSATRAGDYIGAEFMRRRYDGNEGNWKCSGAQL